MSFPEDIQPAEVPAQTGGTFFADAIDHGEQPRPKR
jgi:hypothetical protein